MRGWQLAFAILVGLFILVSFLGVVGKTMDNLAETGAKRHQEAYDSIPLNGGEMKEVPKNKM